MLDQFKAAQDSTFSGFATALEELERGRKSSHWIWYIFPQLAGLGSSSMAKKYGLRDVAEAEAYLRDPVLRGRLQQAAAAVAKQLARGISLSDLMGGRLDAMKLVSSLTLFEVAADNVCRDDPGAGVIELPGLFRGILAAAEQQGFPRCAYTLNHR